MTLTDADIAAIILTLKLATTVTLILLILGLPLAWWLTRTQSWLKAPINALVALPLILPPTVLGFYMLLVMGPQGPLGWLGQQFNWGMLAFSFEGLVLASVVYSLPFVVQPLQTAMASLGERPLEVAATLGAGPLDTFWHVVMPLIRPGLLSASVMGFAHTVGEFGVVLMIGGNIPEETRVVSVQIYDHVEALEYDRAHALSLLLVVFSFVVLALMYWSQASSQRRTWAQGQ